MKCPYAMINDDGEREQCEYTGNMKQVERHRHKEHGEPKWDHVFEQTKDYKDE